MRLVPRRDARVVWCDDGEGLAARAAQRMAALGYSDLRVLDGGVAGWESAGYPVYSGVHVPSKAFAEVVEHEAGTPWIAVEELKRMIDEQADMVLLDSRSYEEYHGNSIPGAISVPGAELVYRFADLVPSPDTRVVVNCGGRTRSIIGAQALINAGVPNEVVSLKNGTQAWHLAGYQVVDGADRRPPEVSPAGLEFAQAASDRVAERFEIRRLNQVEFDAWRTEAGERSTFVLDVRTPEEYQQGHLPGVRSAPGGQLIQETDSYLGVWGGRAALVDCDGVRAVMTASWLLQMGWTDVVVHSFDPAQAGLEAGPYRAATLGSPTPIQVEFVEPGDLDAKLRAGEVAVVDLAYSSEYRVGHMPGAWFALRSRLNEALAEVERHQPETTSVVFTCPDGALASLAAVDSASTGRASEVAVLRGGNATWRARGVAPGDRLHSYGEPARRHPDESAGAG